MSRSMSIAHCAILLAFCTVLAPSARAFGDPPVYSISTPSQTPIGQAFTICLEGPPGAPLLMFIATELGSTPTKFGTLCIKMPALTVVPLFLQGNGVLCFPCTVPCVFGIVGVTVHMTAIIGGPGPGQAGVTNCTSITITDTGLCNGPPPPDPGTQVGDFASFTQGGWGATCSGGNPGCLLAAHFPTVFPNGLLMGDQDGIDGDNFYALLLTSSTAVETFLPEGMARNPFDMDLTDPTNSSAGVLGGQLAAAKVNVAFDAAGWLDPLKAYPGILLKDLVYVSGVDSTLVGKSVAYVIDLADQAVSGALPMPYDVDGDTFPDINFSALNTAVEIINTNFDNGTTNLGHLIAP